jgi:Collagen triple helix repeat (20 copies)
LKPTLRSRLTYSNVIATLCLFLLLGGGTAYAAVHLAKNSVGSKQIRNGAITPAKLSRSARSALVGSAGPKGARGPTGAAGAKGVAGATGAAGAKGAAGANGTALAYALIELEGKINPAQSMGMGAAVVTIPTKGELCIRGLPFTPHNVMATSQYDGVVVSAFVGAYPECPAGTQVSIATEEKGAKVSEPFMLLFN